MRGGQLTETRCSSAVGWRGVAKLVYASIMSLDGYIEDERGPLRLGVPDDEVHAFVIERSVGTYLYGRGMYETVAGWETDPTLAAQSGLMTDFAQIWQAADKIVYSTTLATVSYCPDPA